jgi:hypothetical protein
MSTGEPSILRQLRALGVHVVLVEGRLKARGATSRLTPAHYRVIRQQREDIRAWLCSPRPLDWAVYFDDYPDELRRLAGPLAGAGAKLPSGRNTTARDWARYFVAQPDLFAELVVRARARSPRRTDRDTKPANDTAAAPDDGDEDELPARSTVDHPGELRAASGAQEAAQ